MHRHSALTVVEILILICIVVLLVGILLPAFTAPRRGRHQMQNSTQVRGIHSGLVLYAQGNNGKYVGLNSDGITINQEVGLTVQGRIQKLIDDNYFTLEYVRSPHEVQTGTTSYALLQVNVNEDATAASEGGRNHEWKDTTNTLAPVISDRAVDNGKNFSHIKSIHTTPSAGTSDWRGSVGWNDNHVTFESTHILSTKYGEISHATDHLFQNQTGDAHTGSDAFMVYSSTGKL